MLEHDLHIHPDLIGYRSQELTPISGRRLHLKVFYSTKQGISNNTKSTIIPGSKYIVPVMNGRWYANLEPFEESGKLARQPIIFSS